MTTHRGGTLCATDLDRTLIYSRSALEQWPAPASLVAVERYRDADASFMSARAASGFAALTRVAHVVAVTTRTVEQYSRVRLPGEPSRWAVAANGGVLLDHGVPDRAWAAHVASRLRSVASLDELLAGVRERFRPQWTLALRTADDLFCYAVVDRAALPDDLVAHERELARDAGWAVSMQGRKIYWVPTALTKSAAVAEIAERAGAPVVLAAGDSLLDADLLAAADAGVLARHGELAESGWRAPHVEVTRGCGLAAGDEVVAWFGQRVSASRR